MDWADCVQKVLAKSYSLSCKYWFNDAQNQKKNVEYNNSNRCYSSVVLVVGYSIYGWYLSIVSV